MSQPIFAHRGVRRIDEMNIVVNGNLTVEDIRRFLRDLPKTKKQERLNWELAMFINQHFGIMIAVDGVDERGAPVHDEINTEGQMISVNGQEAASVTVRGRTLTLNMVLGTTEQTVFAFHPKMKSECPILPEMFDIKQQLHSIHYKLHSYFGDGKLSIDLMDDILEVCWRFEHLEELVFPYLPDDAIHMVPSGAHREKYRYRIEQMKDNIRDQPPPRGSSSSSGSESE
jgi:hypothetical protein